jgi:hypothetical protein
MLERQAACRACCFARDSAGKSIEASMAIMAITTSSSMSVKPFSDKNFFFDASRFTENRLSLMVIPKAPPNRFQRQQKCWIANGVIRTSRLEHEQYRSGALPRK